MENHQLYLIVLILTGYNRLVFSQVDKGIALHTESKPVYLYTLINIQKVSFTFDIPEFSSQSQTFENILDIHQKLNHSAVSGISDNMIILNKLLADIESTFKSTIIKLGEIEQYRNSDCTKNKPIKTAVCHQEFRNMIGAHTLIAYEKQITQIQTEIQKAMTTKELNTPGSRHYIEYRKNLQEALDITEVLYNVVDTYLVGLQSLSRLQLNEQQFGLLKEAECLKANPNLEYFEVSECEFCTDTVTCSVTITTPRQRQKLSKLIAIPYFDYELKLNKIYKNHSSNEWVKLDCTNQQRIFTNCRSSRFNPECQLAIEYGQLSNIFNTCKFQESSTQVPTLTEQGILIPNSSFEVYVIKDDKDKMGTKIDILQPYSLPVIIASKEKIKIKDDQFTFLFDRTSKIDKIYKPKYTTKEIEEIRVFVDSPILINDKLIFILTQAAYSSVIFILVSITIMLCTKVYKNQRLIKMFRDNMPSRKMYSKHLTKFMNTTNEQRARK